MQGPALFGDRADTANTGADANADALAVIVGNFETGVADRLFGGLNTVMNKRIGALDVLDAQPLLGVEVPDHARSEEHTSELQSRMRISYAVFCLKKKKTTQKI